MKNMTLKESPTTAFDQFYHILEQRRSVRIFDPQAPFDIQAVYQCLEAATLAPNSSNMQLWEFYVVGESSPLKAPLDKLCLGQKAASTSRAMVVVVARRDKWKDRQMANYNYIKEVYANAPGHKQKQALAYYGKLIPKLYSKYPLWSFIKQLIVGFVGLKKPIVREVSETDVRISIHKSVALAAMTFMYGMKAAGYDTCPMEGFDSKGVKKLLQLPSGAEINMIISCGNALPEGIYGKRFRVPQNQVIFEK
jgi:nitroreductase